MSLELKVSESNSRDVGKAVARIDNQTMNLLQATAGDPVEIKGTDGNTTFAKILPLYPTDEGRGIIRIDGLVRENVGVEVGESIFIKRVVSYPAEVVAVTTSETTPLIDDGYLANATESIYVKSGDKISVPYFGGSLSFNVVSVVPSFPGDSKAAKINQNTRYLIVRGTKPEISLLFKDTILHLDEESMGNKAAILLHIDFELNLSLTETGAYERKVILQKDNLADTLSSIISKFYDIAVMQAKLESIKLWENILAQHDQSSEANDQLPVRMHETLRKLKFRIIEEWVKVKV